MRGQRYLFRPTGSHPKAMPTYEYVCSNCKNEWEEVQRISEPPIKVCPKCSQATAKRQISGGNFILKGGGWYADLYSSSKPAKKDADGGGSGDAKSKDLASAGETKGKEGSPAPAKTESATASKASSSSSGGGGGGGGGDGNS
jgi:putative FmdB family regulatory protein